MFSRPFGTSNCPANGNMIQPFLFYCRRSNLTQGAGTSSHLTQSLTISIISPSQTLSSYKFSKKKCPHMPVDV